MAKHSLPSADDGGDFSRRQELKPGMEIVGRAGEELTGYVDIDTYDGNMAKRVDVKMPIKHRRILHAKLRKLQDEGATLEDGTEVSDRTKAVLWILENEVT